MARRKGATKSKNANNRKHITDSSQPSKGNTRLKDDPGGTTGTSRNKSPHRRNMDGPKLISDARNTSNTMIDHYNLQNHHHQLSYGQSRDSSLLDASSTGGSFKKKGSSNRISESVGDAHETVTSATTTTTQRVATETPTNINNNNNSSSHNNNSSFSNTMTTTMTVSSAANDHKYLHKKFKRIASATSESNSAATANVPEDSSSQSDQHRSQQKHQQQLQNDSNSNISSSSSSSTKSNKVACRLEEISPAKSAKSGHSFKEHGLTPDTERTNSLVKTEESSGSSYIIVNGTGRLTPLFSAVDSVSIADTGYGSDGELKLSVPSNNGLYKTAESVIATQPQLLPANHHHNISNNVAHRMPTSIPATSRTSPCLVVQPPAPVTLNTLRPDITYNSAATKLPHPQQLAQMPSGHSPQHMQLQQIQLQRQPVRHEQPSPQLQQQPVTVDQNNSGRHSCPYCNLNCTKPSVLQKHIRTHTNERPYRCEKCCFAFKTKSNYYKHCRSRSHALRVRGIEPQPEDENSIGSDPDPDPDISNSSSDVISRTASPLDERTSSPAIQYQTASNPSAVQSAPGLNQQHQQNAKYSIDKPYKPKFHNASFYVKEELPAQKQQQQQQQIHLLQLQQQQQLYQQSQQRQQHLQYQQFQQQHQPQLNSYHNSPNSHSMNAQPKVEHPERETSPVYYQQQQLQQAQQLQLQSQQYHNQSSTKSRIEYLAQQRLQAAQSAAAQQASASVIASSSFTESPSSSSTSSSTVPTLGRSLSTGIGGHQLNVEEHISYLISRNEAIVNKELPLQKKYPKVAGKSKSSSTVMSNTTSRLAYTLNNKQQQQQQQQQSPSQQHLQGQLMPQQSNLLTIPGGSLQVGMPMQLQKITVQHQINPSQIAQMHQQQQPPPQQPVQLNEPTPSGSAQPLNLSKIGEQSDLSRKRVPSEGFASPVAASEAVASTSSGKAMPHPQNPERSIIKNLLLHARGEAIPNGEGEQTISTCVLCKMEFHSADDLKTHAVHYCQGGPSSAPISPVGSSGFKYSRSNSISVNLPEMNNPNSLAKLARSKLLLSQNPRSLAKLAWSQLKTKPSNLVLTQLSVNTSSTPQTSSSAAGTSGPNMSQKLMTETPLPSPGPLLGKTPLVESYNNSERKSDDVIITKVHDEARQFVKTSSPKRLKFDGYPQSSSAGAAEVAGPSHGGRMYSSMCGGDMTPLEKKEEPMKRFFSSGGCMIPLSECPDLENSPKIIRTPLLSGGSFQEISPKPAVPQTPKSMISVKPLSSILTPGLPTSGLLNAASLTRFQFPPINSITAYNPLTLPPVSMTAVIPTSVSYGDKVIPFVPGIPGPNSLSSTHLTLQPPKVAERSELSRNVSPNRKKTPSPLMQSSMLYPPPKQPSIRVEDDFERSGDCLPMQRSPRSWVPPTEPPPKKSFNFTRIADNLSPRKTPTIERSTKSPERGVDPPRHFNFDKIEKARSENGSSNPPNNQMAPLHVDISSSSLREREQTTATAGLSSTSVGVGIESKFGAKSKFLRPTSLPLKPGTFTPKCHHGITPTANTLPLISPETPRPSKHCVQLYLNGHAYTYLGLKSSTKMFYCTVNCPQPSYIALNRLSMYSKWQTCEENNPHPLRLGPKAVMSLYDSRQRDPSYSSAPIKSTVKTTHSQPIVSTPFENNTGDYYYHQMKSVPELSSSKSCSGSVKSQKSTGSMPGGRLVGGYESNEDYTYVRGRGRGRYVCSECGIRCKKPSMLKKHIRTHTDVRPYTCQHCSFSFKTKGNLTKHMQSKTHYKKCLELGINLGPMPEGEYGDNEFDYDQQSINSGGGRTSSVPGESDSDEYSDGNEGETESSDTDESKSRLAEHEAARSLLSLSMTPPSNQAAISPNPFTQHHQPKLAYPYSRDHQQQSQQFPESVFQCVSDRCSTDEPLQMNRRVISFTSPKPPFDYQKQEQYFSNPSLSLKTPRNEDAAMKPMDLTKPRRMDGQPQPPLPASSSPSRISEVISESGLIKSLVSITNKIRPNMEHSFVEAAGKFNEDVQLQAYLTEQALKHTKMKQSQMNKTFNMPALSVQSPSMSPTIPTITITDSSHSVQSPGRSSSTGILTSVTTTVTCAVVRSQCSPLPSLTATSLHSEDAPVECETVATCTASPTLANESIEHRMENGEVESPSDDGLPEAPSSSTLKLQPAPNSTTTSAKSVASEYLKMTSAESRNIRVDESDDSCSDQELSSSELAVKPSSTEFTGIVPPTVIVGEDGFKSTNEVQPMFRVHLSDDGRPVCKICSKTFQKQHQMVLHMNIHYMERKFKCEPCAVSFRTQGHLQKHERSEAHRNKVMMNSTFGVPTTSNPRPFECADCKVAFRIHGHLAKHLRSKTHVQKLECLQKLPFGTYAEIERAGISLTEIDTTDCDNSLASLRELAQRLIEKDPTKMGTYTKPSCIDGGTNESSSEDSPEAVASEALDASPGVVSSNSGSGSSVTSSALSSSSVDSPAGVKRKFDSFSSCSNDSISNAPNLPAGSTTVNTPAEGTSEKRIRTNSDP